MVVGPDVSKLLKLASDYRLIGSHYDNEIKEQVLGLFRKGTDLLRGLPIRDGRPEDGLDLRGERFLLTDQLLYQNGSGEIPLQVRGVVVQDGNIALGGIEYVSIEAVDKTVLFGRQELYRIQEQSLLVLGRIVVRDFDLVNPTAENRELVLGAHQILNHFAANLPSRPNRVG